MICPNCTGQGSKVLESRITDAGDATRRRRECISCGERFTTYERVERPTLWVRKEDGQQEPFSSEKLLRGLVIACSKRDIEASVLEDLVREVESTLRATGTKEVSSQEVGDHALKGLVRVDQSAAIRFASVIKRAESIQGFHMLLEQLELMSLDAQTGAKQKEKSELVGSSSTENGGQHPLLTTV